MHEVTGRTAWVGTASGRGDRLFENGGGLRGSEQRSVECFCWGVPVQGPARAVVEECGALVKVGLAVVAEVGALREVLTQQAVGVLV